jgi:hypothetical protein
MIYLFLQILPKRGCDDDERSVDEVDDPVCHWNVCLDDVGDDVLARVVTVALNGVRFDLN